MAGAELLRYLGAGLGLLLVGFGAVRVLAARRGVSFPPSGGGPAVSGWIFVLVGTALLVAALVLEPGGTQAPLFTK